MEVYQKNGDQILQEQEKIFKGHKKSDSTLPLFRSPLAQQHSESLLTSPKAKKWQVKRPIMINDELATNKILPHPVNPKVAARQKKADRQSSLHGPISIEILNGHKFAAMNQASGFLQFSTPKQVGASLMPKLQMMSEFMGNKNAEVKNIKQINKHYVSKRDIEEKLYMPILQEKGKLSYLFEDKSSKKRDKSVISRVDIGKPFISGSKIV